MRQGKDWTSVQGRSNSSREFKRIMRAVEDVLRQHRLGTPLKSTARLIVAQLAHVHGLAPVERTDHAPKERA